MVGVLNGFYDIGSDGYADSGLYEDEGGIYVEGGFDSNDEMFSRENKEKTKPFKPARKVGTLFDVSTWEGKQILAGETYQLDIRRGSWPAEFVYLSRPLESAQAFLSAKIKLDAFLPLPTVQGVYSC